MNKLLNAGFKRLRKNKLFWLLTIFSIGLALFMIYTSYSDMKVYGDAIEVEQLMLNYSTITGIVTAIFTSLFLGVEYSDGAIRNKISTGHKRSDIYLANLFITSITSLFSYILFVVTVAVIGIPIFGGITISISRLLMLLGCILVTVIAYSSIFTFIAMMISNKAITAIVSIMLSFGMMMAAMICFNILDAPELIPEASYVNGENAEIEEVPNPKYPSEEKKKVCQALLDIIPAGQMFQLAGRDVPDLKVLPLYSLGEFIVFAGAGVLLFGKKELK
ncbi:MAG: ABC transporter permease [Bacteroidales bacterium]|nr:ABC transporter permease [Clostridium sp.]MCM1202765.1 ABC transporter permease [Bacteroidales bacterium]